MPTTWINEQKPGSGWLYNSNVITYNGPVDSQQNLIIYYNSLGTATVWAAENKP